MVLLLFMVVALKDADFMPLMATLITKLQTVQRSIPDTDRVEKYMKSEYAGYI